MGSPANVPPDHAFPDDPKSPHHRIMPQLAQLEIAKQAAMKAGEIVRTFYEAGISGTIKSLDGKSQGQVTEADLQSERAITQQILQTYPDHAILAEEEHTEFKTAENLWVIDPLDGTNNFAHGIPHFAISIAYYQNQQPVCGVVHDPLHNDWYVSVKGQGSWHNDRRVYVNQHRTLQETMIALGFYYDRGQIMLQTLDAMKAFFQKDVQGIRRFGTAALDLVNVGLGRFGGYFEYTLSPWDFAAARLFVEEAGGTVSTCQGQPLDLVRSSVLASNGLLHDDMLSIVRRDSITD